MSVVRYLVDTSALRSDEARAGWQELIAAGLVATCPVVELEFLRTARSKADRDRLSELLRTAFGWVPMPERVFDRAGETLAGLTARGSHRSAGVVDLLVAATAELLRLVLVHYDRDFDQVGMVTGQVTRWVVEPGSVA